MSRSSAYPKAYGCASSSCSSLMSNRIPVCRLMCADACVIDGLQLELAAGRWRFVRRLPQRRNSGAIRHTIGYHVTPSRFFSKSVRVYATVE